MIHIPVSRCGIEYEAIVDDEDYPLVAGFKWSAQLERNTGTVYAVCALRKRLDGKNKVLLLRMHRLIVNPGAQEVDHVDGDGLNNRRANLRAATRSQNAMNTRKRHGRPLKGFSYQRTAKRSKPWQARLKLNGKFIFLGYFSTPEEAAKAYDAAAFKYFGDFACPNFAQEKSA